MVLCNAHCFTHALHFSALLDLYLLEVSNLAYGTLGHSTIAIGFAPPIPTPRYPLPCL